MQKTSPFDSPVVALCILHIYRLLFNPSLCNNVGDKVSNSYKEMNFLFIFSISKNAVYEKWKKFTVWVFLLRRSLCHNQLVDGIRRKALYILSWLEVLFLYHSQKRLGHFNPFSSAFWLTLHLKRIHLCRHVKLCAFYSLSLWWMLVHGCTKFDRNESSIIWADQCVIFAWFIFSVVSMVCGCVTNYYKCSCLNEHLTELNLCYLGAHV